MRSGEVTTYGVTTNVEEEQYGCQANVKLGRDFTIDDLFAEGFDASDHI
ncbi:MAG: hypothetical protein ABI234_13700 [Ktedonobacteraceae bacterium]